MEFIRRGSMGNSSDRPAWFLLTRHWVSLAGIALLATAVISWLFVLPQQIRGHVDNPYVGIVVFLLLPVIFFAGLTLIPCTYPNNLGHTDFPGCFRCHDGSHTTADGQTISQDCSACHEPLAMEEASPEIMKTLGIAERISKIQKQ